MDETGLQQPLVDEDAALAAVRRLDAQLHAEYAEQLRDADGLPVRAEALAVNAADRGVDDPEHVELTLGQTDAVDADGAPDAT